MEKWSLPLHLSRYFEEAFVDYTQVKARTHMNKLKFNGFILKHFCYICYASHHNGNVNNILRIYD